jgi:hypothetical protein
MGPLTEVNHRAFEHAYDDHHRSILESPCSIGDAIGRPEADSGRSAWWLP